MEERKDKVNKNRMWEERKGFFQALTRSLFTRPIDLAWEPNHGKPTSEMSVCWVTQITISVYFILLLLYHPLWGHAVA